MQEAGDLLAHLAAIMALGFVISYGFLVPWWRSPIGRNMMAMAVAHLIVFSLIIANLWFGLDWAGRPFVRALVYASIAVIFAWRTSIFLGEYLNARRREKELRNVE